MLKCIWIRHKCFIFNCRVRISITKFYIFALLKSRGESVCCIAWIPFWVHFRFRWISLDFSFLKCPFLFQLYKWVPLLRKFQIFSIRLINVIFFFFYCLDFVSIDKICLNLTWFESAWKLYIFFELKTLTLNFYFSVPYCSCLKWSEIFRNCRSRDVCRMNTIDVLPVGEDCPRRVQKRN